MLGTLLGACVIQLVRYTLLAHGVPDAAALVVKAGLIVAVFMHMAYERLALIYAILVPPVAVLVFVAIMVFESDYTHLTRLDYFGPYTGAVQAPPAH